MLTTDIASQIQPCERTQLIHNIYELIELVHRVEFEIADNKAEETHQMRDSSQEKGATSLNRTIE